MTEWEEKYAALMNEYIHMEVAFVELQKDYDELKEKLTSLLEAIVQYLPEEVVKGMHIGLTKKLAEVEKKPNPFKVVE